MTVIFYVLSTVPLYVVLYYLGQTMSLPYGASLDGYQTGSSHVGTRSHSVYSEHSWNPSSAANIRPHSITIPPPNSNSSDPRLISLSPPGQSSSSQGQGSQGSFFSDLEGLDFTGRNSGPVETKQADTTSASGPKIYPDISAAFR